MSAIAQRKAEERKSSETIFLFMGITFLIFDLLIIVYVLIFADGINRTSMTPILYFLTLAGLCMGIGSYLKEHNYDLRYLNNWFYSFLFLAILAGAILGAMDW